MSDQRTSFYYDPRRQGFDPTLWQTLEGAPTTVNGRLVVDQGAIVSYADILKGDITFNVNVPNSPDNTSDRTFGVAGVSKERFIVFNIGATFSCQTSDGVNTFVVDNIPWDSTDWNSVNLDFRIIWEAGRAYFMVAGTRVATISDVSVPSGALSLYVSDFSNTAATFGEFNVRGTQGYVLNPKTADTSLANDRSSFVFDKTTTSENISIFEKNYTPTFSDSTVTSESVTVVVPINKPSLFDSTATSESVTVGAPH